MSKCEEVKISNEIIKIKKPIISSFTVIDKPLCNQQSSFVEKR